MLIEPDGRIRFSVKITMCSPTAGGVSNLSTPRSEAHRAQAVDRLSVSPLAARMAPAYHFLSRSPGCAHGRHLSQPLTSGLWAPRNTTKRNTTHAENRLGVRD